MSLLFLSCLFSFYASLYSSPFLSAPFAPSPFVAPSHHVITHTNPFYKGKSLPTSAHRQSWSIILRRSRLRPGHRRNRPAKLSCPCFPVPMGPVLVQAPDRAFRARILRPGLQTPHHELEERIPHPTFQEQTLLPVPGWRPPLARSRVIVHRRPRCTCPIRSSIHVMRSG